MAIFGASILSCFALPPWIAFIERAGPSTNGSPSRAHKSASQVPGEETFGSDGALVTMGAITLSKASGLACRCRCTRMAPSRLRRHTYRVRACLSIRSTLGAAWCRIASGLLLFGGLSQCQQTTAGCRGGGLTKYHRTGADVAHSAAPLSAMALYGK
jgi:hypothetical protein